MFGRPVCVYLPVDLCLFRADQPSCPGFRLSDVRLAGFLSVYLHVSPSAVLPTFLQGRHVLLKSGWARPIIMAAGTGGKWETGDVGGKKGYVGKPTSTNSRRYRALQTRMCANYSNICVVPPQTTHAVLRLR